MLKEVILVPKDKCPLDVLAELGATTGVAWIFLHKTAVEKLRQTANTIVAGPLLLMDWDKTEKYPATTVYVENTEKEWAKVRHIDASDITFQYEPDDPECLFFLKMAE